jgi:hypothetical protein
MMASRHAGLSHVVRHDHGHLRGLPHLLLFLGLVFGAIGPGAELTFNLA